MQIFPFLKSLSFNFWVITNFLTTFYSSGTSSNHFFLSNCSLEEKLTSPQGDLDYYFFPNLYPSNRKCRWRIYSKPFYWIKVSFQVIQTECSWDVINVFEANSTFERKIASFCGNDTTPELHDLVSESEELVIEFTSDADISSYGFKATYEIIDPCAWSCSGHGVCIDQMQCTCDSSHVGLLCERETMGNTPLPPRYNHASYYDVSKDTLTIAGGRNLQNDLSWSMFEYSFSTLTWKDITSGSFGSFSIQYLFKYKNEMYLLGQKTTWSLWKYDDRNNTWLYLPSRSSVSPPLLNYTSFVAAQEENKVFILGGGTQISSKFVPSRYLFAYDFESFSWIQLNSIYFPLASVYGTYDSPAIYRSLTRYIYVFSPKEIYMYHVTSDLWYTVSYDEFPSLSYLSSHSVSFMEPFAIFSGGQLAPFQSYGASRACLNKLIFIVDLDCWTMTTVSQGDPRSGHSTILRDRQLWIFGGYRGFALNDFFSTPALTFPPTKESCRVETRCLHHNDCDDCLLIPGCGWCQDACSYGCTNRVCPSRQTLNLSEIYNGVLSGFSFMNFKIFINDPNQDIYFYFSGTKTLNLSILNLPPKFSFNATGPLAMFSYMDSRRFGGWYVLQLSNPYPESVDFQFVVSLQVPTILPNNFDLNPYLSLGFGALSLLLSACLIMKRYRDNVHRRTSCTNSQAKPMTPMYTTHLVQLRSNSSKSGSSSPTSPLIPQKKGFIPISAQLQTPLVYVSYLICMPPSDSRVLKLMVATGTFLVSPSSLPKDKKTKIRSKKKKS